MKAGTTTFGFRYLMQDPERAPALTVILDRARALGLDALQICENARPLDLSAAEWRAVIDRAGEIGLEIELGCLTLDVETLSRYLERAAMIPSRTVRIVLEEHGRGKPDRDCMFRFMDAAAPRLKAAGMRLAVENHFDIPCRTLAELGAAWPPEILGFCLDTANSLRNFESAEQVFSLLEDRAVCYHLKDYRVQGDNIGFRVGGAPLGVGDLALESVLRRIFERNPAPRIFLENWVPSKGDWLADVDADAAWLEQSLANLRAAVTRCR